MDEYKSRLSTYLSDMVREELEKYDGGFTDEMNDQRGKNAEVLGYKLSGTSDVKEVKKMKDKRTNKAYNPDKMFDKAITSKWFKRIAKRIKNNITRLQSPYLIP